MAIVQCVPNFSEGRDLEKIEKIVQPLRVKEGVKLLNYEADKNYNRLVVTVIGEPNKVKNAVLESIGVAHPFFLILIMCLFSLFPLISLAGSLSILLTLKITIRASPIPVSPS